MNIKNRLKYIIVFLSLLCMSYLLSAYYSVFNNLFGQALDSGGAIAMIIGGLTKTHAYDNFFLLFNWSFRTIALCLVSYALLRFMILLKNTQLQFTKPQNDQLLVTAPAFGGWLLLLGFSLIISTIISPVICYQFFDLFLTVSNSDIKLVLFFELIRGFIAFLFLLVVLVSFLQKHKSTPKLLKILLLLNIFTALLLLLLSTASDSNQLKKIYVYSLLKNILSAVIVITYLSYSKRVKETFVNE